MAKKKIIDRIEPVIKGTADEILPFALAHVRQYAEVTDVDSVIDDLEADLGDACESVHPRKGEDRERRATLFRVAARALVLLALDEVKRGGRAAARDAKALDELGYVKKKPSKS